MTSLLRTPRLFILGLSLWTLWSCAPLANTPEQPALTEPFARLTFSSAMKLAAVDNQPVESRQAIRTLRVRPGPHTLQFIHVNDGPEGSADHAGQLAAPFPLEAYAGITYEFEAKT